ncbi:MAG: hypothetical protein QOH06_855 [Acidobacteriota bacterium]|nr:hypothetical protein [Acidobacteriota bacterium]
MSSNRRSIATSLALAIFCLLPACSSHRGGYGGPGSRQLGTVVLDAPGVAMEEPDTLLVAAQLRNTSKTPFTVTIDSIQLDSVPSLTPAPVSKFEIEAGGTAMVQANFNSSQLSREKQYQLVVHGTYQEAQGARRRELLATTVIVLPPATPGSANVRTVTAPPNKVANAPYPPQRPSFDNERNRSRWTVPTGRFVPGEPTRSSTSTEKVVIGDPPAIVFNVNNGIGITNGSSIAEPSGGDTGGGVIFVTSNWFAAFATDGGTAFTQLNPTTIFPADVIGYCCDQIVQYVPSIDRFIWLLQGNNGYRLASASPADLAASGGTAWTYWNLPSDLFGQPNGTGVDYPDLSVGNGSLYMSWDVGWPTCPAGCRGGFQVTRTSLAGIQAGGTISLDYTNPPDASMAWGGHLMQNTLDEIFWAGHNSNSQMRVFSLQEGSGTYFWRDVGISTWANNALSSTTPDGQNWLAGSGGFPGNAVIGSTRVRNQLWFAWSAGTDQNFRQPHVEMVTLDRNNNFNRIQQVQIWNESYAFAYPALATNACTQEVGLSFEFGGGGNYENHVVGFWGDFVAYITTGSNVGTTRFGDYVTIRQTPRTRPDPGNMFSAFGYGLNSAAPPGAGTRTDIHYVLFGRPAEMCKVGADR